MKKSKKKLLIISGTIIGIFLLTAVGLIIKVKSETKNMITTETGKITENIFALKDTYVNMFFIKTGEEYIAIDAGNNIKNIKKGMKDLNIDPQKVIAVLLTHSDNDHIAALELFTNAKVFISEKEEQIMNGETARFWIFKTKNKFEHTSIQADEEINISGIKIKGILTPGHTPGSMCWLINNKYLFTGDNLSLKDGKAELFNDLFNIDSELQAKSLKKLAYLNGIEYVFTAHYGYTDDFEVAFKDWK